MKNTAEIVISANDQASKILGSIAKKMEGLNNASKSLGFGKWGEGFKAIGVQMGGVTKAFSALKTGATYLAGVTAAIGGAGLGMTMFAKKANDAVREVDDLATRYQVSAEMIQVYGAAVKESGGTMEEAAAGIFRLKKAQAEAIGGSKELQLAFAGVGLSLADLKKMDAQEIMYQMADAFKDSNKDLQKIKVLTTVMGKSGTAYMATMNAGAAATRDLYRDMVNDGRIFTEEQIKNSKVFDDAWNKAEGTVIGFKNLLGTDLANALLPFVQSFPKWLVDNKDSIRSSFKEFLEKLPRIIESVTGAFRSLWGAGVKISSFFSGLSDVLGGNAALWVGIAAILAAPIVLFGVIGAKIALVTAGIVALFAGMAKLWDCIKTGLSPLGEIFDKFSSIGGVVASLFGPIGLLAKAFKNFLGLSADVAKTGGDLSSNPGGFIGAPSKALSDWSYGDFAGGRDAAPTSSRPANMPSIDSPVAAARMIGNIAPMSQDIKNTVDLRIKVDGAAQVVETKAKPGADTKINVKTGLAMQGGY